MEISEIKCIKDQTDGQNNAHLQFSDSIHRNNLSACELYLSCTESPYNVRRYFPCFDTTSIVGNETLQCTINQDIDKTIILPVKNVSPLSSIEEDPLNISLDVGTSKETQCEYNEAIASEYDAEMVMGNKTLQSTDNHQDIDNTIILPVKIVSHSDSEVDPLSATLDVGISKENQFKNNEVTPSQCNTEMLIGNKMLQSTDHQVSNNAMLPVTSFSPVQSTFGSGKAPLSPSLDVVNSRRTSFIMHETKSTEFDAESIIDNEPIQTVDCDYDKTIVLPSKSVSPVGMPSFESATDPLSITLEVNSSKINPFERQTKSSSNSNYCTSSDNDAFNETSPILIDPRIDGSSLDFSLGTLPQGDESSIGSLLMLSTELNHSLSSPTDIFNGENIDENVTVIVPNFQSDIHSVKLGSKNASVSKKLVFNSPRDKIENEVDKCSVDTNSIVLLQKHMNNSGIDFSEHVADEDGNISISLCEYQKLLPSMKTQLKQLMLYIKHISDKNTGLEEEINTIKNDFIEINQVKQQLSIENSKIKEENTFLEIELKNINAERKNIEMELELLKDNCSKVNNHEFCQNELESAREEIQLLHRELEKSALTLKNQEQECREHIQKSDDKYSSLCCQTEALKASLEQSEVKIRSLEENNRQIVELSLKNETLNALLQNAESEIKSLKNENEQIIDLSLENKSLKSLLQSADIKIESLIEENKLITDLSSSNDSLKKALQLAEIKIDTLENENKLMNELSSNNKSLKELLECAELKITSLEDENKNMAVVSMENKSLKESLQNLENKIQSLQDDNKRMIDLSLNNESLRESLHQAELKIKLLEDESKNNVDLVCSNESMKEQISELKNELSELSNKNNRLIEEKEILKIEEQDYISSVECLKNESAVLKQDIEKIKKSFSQLLNLPDNSTFDELLFKFQKYVYDFTILEEKLESEKVICNNLKVEHRSLDERCLSLDKEVERLSCELSTSNEKLADERKICTELEQKYDQLQRLYDEKITTSNSGSEYELSEERSGLFKSDVKTSGEEEAICSHCREKDNKMKEKNLLLIERNSLISSQQLEIDNLKSRFYSKCADLDKTLEKSYDLKKKVMFLEKENKDMKKIVEGTLVAKVTRDLAVQCDQTQEKPQPPNYVQLCKIKELHCKVEKLHRISLSLEKESKKKDEKINLLKEEISNINKSSSHDKNRIIFEDKTNAQSS